MANLPMNDKAKEEISWAIGFLLKLAEQHYPKYYQCDQIARVLDIDTKYFDNDYPTFVCNECGTEETREEEPPHCKKCGSDDFGIITPEDEVKKTMKEEAEFEKYIVP